jgi:peptidoglycan/xylan/chitin deacetylase (PgdA/CDA1 family)
MPRPLLLTTLLPTAWHAPWLIRASLVWHVLAAVALLAHPALWPWVLGALVLNHLLLTGVALWPRSTWLGHNIRRLPDAAAARREIALTFDDGPDPHVTPAVLDALDTHGAKATFFCIAERAIRHPALCAEIVRRGHSVQNHSDRHALSFALSGLAGFERELGGAQTTLRRLCGETPAYFRAPAGLRNPLLGAILERHRLQLVSWTRRGFDTVQRRPERVLRRLSAGLAAGDILVLHDGNGARTADGRPVLLSVLPELLRLLAQQRLQAVTLPQAFGPGPDGAVHAATTPGRVRASTGATP